MDHSLLASYRQLLNFRDFHREYFIDLFSITATNDIKDTYITNTSCLWSSIPKRVAITANKNLF
jgi:hypothetical protein